MEDVKTYNKRHAWNKGLTKETDERVRKNAENTRKTVLKKYGTTTVLQSKEVLSKIETQRHNGEFAKKSMETKLSRYGDSNYNNMSKNKATKLEKYGDENYNNQEKHKETCLNKYGVEHHNKNPEIAIKISNSRIKNKSNEKAKQTIIAKYGDLTTYYKEKACKKYETMKKNGTLWVFESKPKKELYIELCNNYGEEHVFKQYYDKERYPFKCDFYIDSEDLFIELNGFITHGPHPYDKNNIEDIKLEEKLKNDNTEWSKSILYTWTDLDVRKLKCAQENNLNFEMIYWYENKKVIKI